MNLFHDYFLFLKRLHVILLTISIQYKMCAVLHECLKKYEATEVNLFRFVYLVPYALMTTEKHLIVSHKPEDSGL